MNVVNDVLKLVSKLPPEGLSLLSKLIRDLLTAPPAEALERLRQSALAAGSRKAYRRK